MPTNTEHRAAASRHGGVVTTCIHIGNNDAHCAIRVARVTDRRASRRGRPGNAGRCPLVEPPLGPALRPFPIGPDRPSLDCPRRCEKPLHRACSDPDPLGPQMASARAVRWPCQNKEMELMSRDGPRLTPAGSQRPRPARRVGSGSGRVASELLLRAQLRRCGRRRRRCGGVFGGQELRRSTTALVQLLGPGQDEPGLHPTSWDDFSSCPN